MNKIILFIIAFITWSILTWSFNYQDVLAGTGASILIAFLLGDLFVINLRKVFSLRRLFWALCSVPVFLYYCIKANFIMAYRILHPKLPIRPGIVKIKTGLKSALARAFLANFITLTPGTLTVDIKGEYLYIHWIYVESEDIERATGIIAGRFESILKRIFE